MPTVAIVTTCPSLIATVLYKEGSSSSSTESTHAHVACFSSTMATGRDSHSAHSACRAE